MLQHAIILIVSWTGIDNLIDAVYGKTCEQALKLHGLQKGQRVCFDIYCVAQIRFQTDDDDEENDSDDD